MLLEVILQGCCDFFNFLFVMTNNMNDINDMHQIFQVQPSFIFMNKFLSQ
jgi:hypothetical protein